MWELGHVFPPCRPVALHLVRDERRLQPHVTAYGAVRRSLEDLLDNYERQLAAARAAAAAVGSAVGPAAGGGGWWRSCCWRRRPPTVQRRKVKQFHLVLNTLTASKLMPTVATDCR